MNKDVEHEIILDVLISNCTMKNIEDTYNNVIVQVINSYNKSSNIRKRGELNGFCKKFS